jgi:NAD(P)-dependent dehydrogenase (short-subunit alcohol dehydrogenase family)
MNREAKRVALVSGGAKAIGAGIAVRLSRNGWRVVVADREPAGAAPEPGRYVVCDVGEEAAISGLLRSIATTERRLDALICNAGFMIRKPIADLSLSEWSSVLATNLTSTFLSDQYVSIGPCRRGTASRRQRCGSDHCIVAGSDV